LSLTDFVKKQVAAVLEERRVVVWYDAERAFAEVARGFAGAVSVDASASRLRARRAVDEALQRVGDPEAPPGAREAKLLVYAPWPRPLDEEGRLRDPLAAFAEIGAAFGDKEGERLASLARQAMPDRATEIDRLFAEGSPSVATIEGLVAGAQHPLLREALGTDSPVEVVALLLAKPGATKLLAAVPGALEDLKRMLKAELGFAEPRLRALDSIVAALGRYVLFSEFALDLPVELPATLAEEPRAEEKQRARIFAICDRMRGADDTREGAIELARRVEGELKLRERAGGIERLGVRDTFPFEERAYLSRLEALAREGQLERAREVVSVRKCSIWRHLPERAVLWKLAERCLDLLAAAKACQGALPGAGAAPGVWVQAYVAREGLWTLDRHQRLVEQGTAECAEDGEVGALVHLCRQRYREVAEAAQERFLAAVARSGWPPEGTARQTQTFDKHVGPALAERRRVAYFLVDAMRFEMGCDLAATLDALGPVSVVAAATVIPTTTPCGMAALMPGADGAWALAEAGEELVPTVAGRALPTVNERKALLSERFGDRMRDLRLVDICYGSTKKLAADVGQADLIVVRSTDIDWMGEGGSLPHARKHMTDVIGEVRKATDRLAALGIGTFVFVADHGHVLLPEVAAGDVVAVPEGTWRLSKRRCRLGSGAAGGRGVVVIPARHLGISGPVTEVAVPTGFRVFTAGEAYFHEGISLQECLVPVVVLHARSQPGRSEGGEAAVEVRYRSDKFTSRVVGLRVWFNSLIVSDLAVRIEAYDGPGKGAALVGEAADCDAREANTKLVTLERGKEVQVPLRVQDAFKGAFIEVRAVDPTNGNVLHRLKLKNASLE